MSTPTARTNTVRSAWLAAAVVFCLHTVLRTAIVLGPGMGGSSLSDEQSFHLPAIATFAEQWPAVDLSNYAAASTPAYHLVFAFIEHMLGHNVIAWQLASGTLISLLVAMVAWVAARHIGAWRSVALVTPLIASPYLMSCSTLVIPESASWLGLTAAVLLALRLRVRWWTLALAGVLTLALVLTRQIYLWTAALAWTTAWLGSTTNPGSPGSPLIPPREDWHLPTRLARILLAIAFTAPAFAAFAYFWQLWDGPTPPMFQTGVGDGGLAGTHTGGNLAFPALMLAIIGFATPFYTPMMLRPISRMWRTHRAWLLACALIGAAFALLAAIAPETTWNRDAGRYSGLWSIARSTPVIAGRSTGLAALATLGGIACGVAFAVLPRRHAWVLLASLVAFTAAQSANAQAWHRYAEPMVLLLTTLVAALARDVRVPVAHDVPASDLVKHELPAWTLAGPLLLACLLAVLTVNRLG